MKQRERKMSIIKNKLWWKRLLGIEEKMDLHTLAVRIGMCDLKSEGLVLSRPFVQFLIENRDEITALSNSRASDGDWLPIPKTPSYLPLSCIAPIVIWLRKNDMQVTAEESVQLALLFKRFAQNLMKNKKKDGENQEVELVE